MTTTHNQDVFVARAIAAVATLAPIALILVAGTLPSGLAQGQLVVYACIGITTVLAAALVLHASYARGFKAALKRLSAMNSNLVTT